MTDLVTWNFVQLKDEIFSSPRIYYIAESWMDHLCAIEHQRNKNSHHIER